MMNNDMSMVSFAAHEIVIAELNKTRKRARVLSVTTAALALLSVCLSVVWRKGSK